MGVIIRNGYKRKKEPKAFGELPRTIGLYSPYPSLPQENRRPHFVYQGWMDTLKQHLYITKSHHGDGLHVVISLVQPTTVVNGREYAEVSSHIVSGDRSQAHTTDWTS